MCNCIMQPCQNSKCDPLETFYIVTSEGDGYVSLTWFKSKTIALAVCGASNSKSCELHEFQASNISGVSFSDSEYCPDCGKRECEHQGIYCDFCDRGCVDVEIHHVCTTLGTICIDCDSSGEYPEYWEPEENE